MKLRIDRTKCVGHGLCVARTPEVFSFDDEGYILTADGTVVAEEHHDSARISAAVCPEVVIEIIED